MNAVPGNITALSVAIAGVVVGIAVLIGLIGNQLFASARTANKHLANATLPSFSPGAGPGERPGANAARPAETAASASDTAQQIFERLNQYYAANINQGNAIFWASLLSMSVGFAILFVGILTAGTNTTTAIVAGVAGVLSQFIAATFLVALRSTQAQSTAYAQSLVELRLRDARTATDAQSVALGLRLLDEISGDGATALANQTRAALAMGLIVKEAVPLATIAPPPSAPGDGDGNGGARGAPVNDGRVRAQSVTFEGRRDTGIESAH